ncbi:breast carcinoma-amplified sequence 1 isoform X3 [Cygnus olor]|uniref:breast carcinoma-amplified sequence 1 isoform X3 n=1 Tax=Cygnus olor TaxID=8869 RepID=UPI001ADE0050|nr:breast carcinoma-amplified sequence 1 isoform X3 [Cygnus olor]XP_040431791.1 breast carcinoma-amplified sequence 1 isoform X3 [Cygnus olor]
MGNTVSVPEEVKEDNACPVISYQALPESPTSVKNGSAVFVQTHPPATNGGVDAKASVARDNAAASSPKTKEQSAGTAGGEAAGSTASRALPSAKSRSVFAFSWSVPGRTEDPASDSSVGSAKLDLSSEAPDVNKALSDSVALPAAAAPEPGAHKILAQAQSAPVPHHSGLAAPGTPEGEAAAAPKPKQVNFFDKIFKLEKGKERSQEQTPTQKETKASDAPDGCSAVQEAAGSQRTSNGIPPGKEIDDCNRRDLRQDLASVNSLTAEQPARAEVNQDSPQAAAAVDNHSVMSFFKTLVSPSKAETKSEPEDKAAKGTQQTTNTKSTEQQPVSSVKSDKNVPSSQELQTAKQNTKAPEPAAQQQATATEAPKEVTKEKASSTPMPLSKLFWKKNTLEEAETISNEKADASSEAVAPDKDKKSPEAAEVKPRKEESKTPKANLRKFFKLSGKGDGGTTRSEEVNGPSPSHQTSNSTERPVATAESEPVGQKSKESSKDKKSTVELSKQKGSKQEAREQPDSREQQTAETDSIQNGGDASKEPSSYKRTEKRQSLGGFFKGLGSKRMSDAEVQTDPVSILPAGKSK